MGSGSDLDTIVCYGVAFNDDEFEFPWTEEGDLDEWWVSQNKRPEEDIGDDWDKILKRNPLPFHLDYAGIDASFYTILYIKGTRQLISWGPVYLDKINMSKPFYHELEDFMGFCREYNINFDEPLQWIAYSNYS